MLAWFEEDGVYSCVFALPTVVDEVVCQDCELVAFWQLLEVLGGLVTEAVELAILACTLLKGPHECLVQVLELLLGIEVLLFSELLRYSSGAYHGFAEGKRLRQAHQWVR